jgi:hypothetical protein
MNAQYRKIAAPGKFAVSAMASPRATLRLHALSTKGDLRTLRQGNYQENIKEIIKQDRKITR